MLENFFIGLVSGIVSSFIVTIIFRENDRKRAAKDYIDRLIAFLMEYYYTCDNDSPNITSIENLTKKGIPKVIKYYKFSNEEKGLINKIIDEYNKNYTALLNYASLLSQRNAYENLLKKYKKQIEDLKTKIIEFTISIQSI